MSTTETPGFVDAVNGELVGDTPSEVGVAYAGHIDARAFAESIEASALISSYAVIDEEGGYRYDPVVTIESIAIEMLKSQGRTPESIGNENFMALLEDGLSALQSALADRRAWSRTADQRDRNGYIGAVSLYTPPVGDRYQDRSHATAPAVCFYEIRFGSFLWTAERRAMAVWFTPEVDAHGEPVNPGVGRAGQLYSNDKFEAGYQAVVRFFPSVAAAKSAYRELLQAAQIAARPPAEADEPGFREQMLTEDEAADRQAARQSKQGQARKALSGF